MILKYLKVSFVPPLFLKKPFKTMNLLEESSWCCSVAVQSRELQPSLSSAHPSTSNGSSTDQYCLAPAAPMGRAAGHLLSPQWGRGAVLPVGPQLTYLGGWLRGIPKELNLSIAPITQLPPAGKPGTCKENCLKQ